MKHIEQAALTRLARTETAGNNPVDSFMADSLVGELYEVSAGAVCQKLIKAGFTPSIVKKPLTLVFTREGVKGNQESIELPTDGYDPRDNLILTCYSSPLGSTHSHSNQVAVAVAPLVGGSPSKHKILVPMEE